MKNDLAFGYFLTMGDYPRTMPLKHIFGLFMVAKRKPKHTRTNAKNTTFSGYDDDKIPLLVRSLAIYEPYISI